MPLIEEIFEDNVETNMKEDSVKVKIEVVEDKENNRNFNNTKGMLHVLDCAFHLISRTRFQLYLS